MMGEIRVALDYSELYAFVCEIRDVHSLSTLKEEEICGSKNCYYQASTVLLRNSNYIPRSRRITRNKIDISNQHSQATAQFYLMNFQSGYLPGACRYPK